MTATTCPEEQILAHLARCPLLTAGEIARATGAASPPTVKRILTDLAGLGHVVRVVGPRSENDHRPCTRWRLP
jgi:DNA-binding MarR family transcriptional regulator